ncbi:alpha-(1,3)-fucosyltransferase 7 [Hydra vulgaris]|uniref:Fucosyltransferase n=1 Tax=Hydra vulgaris TaxID=6087 RepID=T2MGL8_HYDVU|nr:alpha-(1,3)-fucosyltransferase 7-like [Hydra vulgaris]
MIVRCVLRKILLLLLLIILIKFILIFKYKINSSLDHCERKYFNKLNYFLGELQKQKATIVNTELNTNLTEANIFKNAREEEYEVNTDYLLNKKKKLILIYTPLFGSIPWPHVPYDYNFTELDQSPCHVNHCELTYNKKEIMLSNAVLFHARDLPHEQVLREIRKNPEQIWIWLMNESPKFTYLNLSLYNGLFNWTATYRTDSEIFLPYYGIRKLVEPTGKIKNFAEGKDKKILYITSHCDDTRINFVRNLKKYISVDVYGACAKVFQKETKDCKKNTLSCEELKRRYKFVLAYENSFCIDYVTEKYYKNGLLSEILPIVAGGANYSKEKIAISGSFINIHDYKNIRDLVSYLNYLDMNDESYNKYFQWKTYYKVELEMALCKVCKALWEDRPETTIDLEKFWSVKNTCINEADRMKNFY